MGDDEHEGGSGAELAEELLESRGALIDGERVSEIVRGDSLAGEIGGVVEVLWGWLLGWRDEGRGEHERHAGGASEWAKKGSHATGISGL
jgi:hypothetical protein